MKARKKPQKKSRSKALKTKMHDEQDIIRSIINVNYAGEFGAIRLYGGQLLIVRLLYPEMINVIDSIKNDEKKHCRLFLEIMPEYGLRPCRLTWIWKVAGFMLGITTPLLGRRALLTSIKAAEDTAHEHLGAQVNYLKLHDVKLAEIIAEVQVEEKKHVSISERELGSAAASLYERLVYKMVYKLCQMTMWLVTRGASAQLKQELVPT